MHSSMMTAEQIIGLNQDHLLHISDNSELLGQKFQCHHEALVPIAKLIRRSEQDGIPMRIISSYRSFEHQLTIWNKKYYQEVTLNLRDGSTVNSQDLDGQERVNAILHYSALPGAVDTTGELILMCLMQAPLTWAMTSNSLSRNLQSKGHAPLSMIGWKTI